MAVSNTENTAWNNKHNGDRCPKNDTGDKGAPFAVGDDRNTNDATGWARGSANRAMKATNDAQDTPITVDPLHLTDYNAGTLDLCHIPNYLWADMQWGYGGDARNKSVGDGMGLRAYPTPVIYEIIPMYIDVNSTQYTEETPEMHSIGQGSDWYSQDIVDEADSLPVNGTREFIMASFKLKTSLKLPFSEIPLKARARIHVECRSSTDVFEWSRDFYKSDIFLQDSYYDELEFVYAVSGDFYFRFYGEMEGDEFYNGFDHYSKHVSISITDVSIESADSAPIYIDADMPTPPATQVNLTWDVNKYVGSSEIGAVTHSYTHSIKDFEQPKAEYNSSMAYDVQCQEDCDCSGDFDQQYETNTTRTVYADSATLTAGVVLYTLQTTSPNNPGIFKTTSVVNCVISKHVCQNGNTEDITSNWLDVNNSGVISYGAYTIFSGGTCCQE